MTDVDKRMLSLFGAIILLAIGSQVVRHLKPDAFEDDTVDLVPQPAGSQVVDVAP